MKAVIIEKAEEAAVCDIKEQSMRPDYVKIKTVALAVNPTDFHHMSGAGPVGGILGCDLSGTVQEVGEACKTDVRKGDKVYAVCHCANNDNLEDGAFAEFAMVKDGMLAKIPEGMSFEETASLGVGVTTIAQTLYLAFAFPLPPDMVKPHLAILINGGSTATGTIAIQYAKMSGLTVITTCSPKNFELVKSRGADAVFDYNDPECATKMRSYTKDSLRYVLDCISTESSYKICADTLSSNASLELHCVTLLPAETWPRKDVNPQPVLAYTSFGEEFSKFGATFPSMQDHYELSVKFWEIHAKLLAEGRIKPHPITVREGGLQGIPQGIKDLGEGTVSATKLVYRVSDTPGVA